MSRLTAAERKALPDSAFGLPESRQYPMADRTHAIDAKARAKQELERGLLSKSDYERICRKADEVLATDAEGNA